MWGDGRGRIDFSLGRTLEDKMSDNGKSDEMAGSGAVTLLWVIGFLFTLGLMIGEDIVSGGPIASLNWYESAGLTAIVFVSWPAILGFHFAGLH